MSKKTKKKKNNKLDKGKILIISLGIVIALILLTFLYENFIGFYGMPARCFTVEDGKITEYKSSCGVNVKIPKKIWFKEIDTITYAAFSESNIEELEISSNIENIGDYAFYKNKLKKVNIPSTVKNMGYGVFNENPTDKEIFWYKLENGKWDYSVLTGYSNKNVPNTILIPNSKEEIELKKIDKRVFYQLGVSKVVIPDSVIEIGEEAFKSNALEEVKLPKNIKNLRAGSFGYNPISKIDLPLGLESIGGGVFNQSKITKLDIPSTVNTISMDAFLGMDALKVINLDMKEDSILNDPSNDNWGAKKAIVNWLR